MSRQSDLLALFAQTQDALETFIATRSAAERAAVGSEDAWSAKDLVAMIAFWFDYTVDRMATHARGETPSNSTDFAGINLRGWTASQFRSWDQVCADARNDLAALTRAVANASDDLLMTTNVYGDGPGGPFVGEVEANGFIWPLQELEKYYQRVGESERATAMRDLLRPVVGEPEIITCELITPEAIGALANPVIIDVRDAAEYAAGHVTGARHIPLAALPDHLAELPRDQTIITYCMMRHPGQSRGERAAALLQREGFQSAAIAGGFPAWQASGATTKSGDAE